MVPLELPVVHSNEGVSVTAAAAAAAAAVEGCPPQEVLTRDQEKQLDAVGWRMLNLPLIVCQSANGMPFFFPLQKVVTLQVTVCYDVQQQSVDHS